MRTCISCTFPAKVQLDPLVNILGVSGVEGSILAQENVDVKRQPEPTPLLTRSWVVPIIQQSHQSSPLRLFLLAPKRKYRLSVNCTLHISFRVNFQNLTSVYIN